MAEITPQKISHDRSSSDFTGWSKKRILQRDVLGLMMAGSDITQQQKPLACDDEIKHFLKM